MNNSAKSIAVSSMMTALGVVFLSLGSMIPLATYCTPALAAVALIPVILDLSKGYGIATYAATAILGVMLATDKEAALLYAFLGYYPLIKFRLDRIPRRPIRVALKLLIFNVAVGLMTLTMILLFGLNAVLNEWVGLTGILLAAFLVIANISMLLFDLLYVRLEMLYCIRLRPYLFRNEKR